MELGADVVDGGLVECSGDALVHAQALVLFGDVVGVDADGDAEVEDGGGVRGLVALALHLVDGFFEHGGVHLEADGLDVAGLFSSEHVACAAELEVEGGDLESCAEVGELLEGGEAAACDLGELGVWGDEQVGVGAAVGAAYAAAELVELGEAVAVGAVDDDGVGEGDVEAVLDDGGGDEDVVLVVHEGEHDAFELGLGELTVTDDDAGGGDELADEGGELVDVFDAVVDEVDLAAAFELHFDRGADELFVVLGDDGLDGHAVFGRGLDDGHVAEAEEGHVEGAGDGCGRHGEDVDGGAHLLEALLVADAEALFFVDDEEAEILELELLGEDGVGADEDVYLAGFCGLDDDGFFLRGAEAREHLDVDGEVGEALFEGLEVLEREDGGGGEDGDLFAILHGLEGGAHGDFGLAVADVAAEEAVHGLGGLHVGLDVDDGGELVVGFGEGEGVFELALEVVVGREGGAYCRLALGVELEELSGHISHGFLDAGLGLLPGLGAEFVEDGSGSGLGGAIFLDEVETGERDVELGGVGELEDHELELVVGVFVEDAEAAVLGDAVFDVDDVVSYGEVAEVGDEGGGFGLAGGGAGGDVGFVGEVVGTEDDDLACGGFLEVEDLDAVGDGRADDDGGAGVAGEVGGFGVDGFGAGGHVAGAEAVGDLVLLEEGGEAFDFALVGGGEQDAGLLLDERVDGVDEGGDGAVESRGGAGVELDFGEGGVVGVEDVDGSELVEFGAGELAESVVELPGRDVDVLGADEIADAGAIVALLDLVPPALALIFDHGGLFDEDAGVGADEIEEGFCGSGDGCEELPAGEDCGFTGAGGDVGLELGGGLAALELCGGCGAGAGEARVDGLEDLFGDGDLGEREQERGVEGGGAALGFGVEFADGFDLVAEEVDADGAVHFWGVDVEDAAAQGELAGHLDDVDAGVADGEEVVDEHIGEVLLAGAETKGEGGVEVGLEELEAGGLDGRDDELGGF